ncbi:MAG: LysM peptidoglycan-binding domain-containing protein, partial [Gemmatimonadales bacterium]
MRAHRVSLALAALLVVSACSASPSPTSSPGPTTSGTGSAAPTATETPFGTSVPTDTPPASAVPTTAGTSYTVRPGDTLSSIARTWGTTVPQLQAWNADRYPSLATDPGTLLAGWVLLVSGDPGTTPLPTVAPTPAVTIAPSSCRAGNRAPAGNAETFSTVPGAGHAVALTLDMGGRLDPGLQILDLLIANGVCATIFPTGAMAQTPAGQQVMAVIRAHPELFEIGNHTMHHCNLVSGGGASPTSPLNDWTEYVTGTEEAAIYQLPTGGTTTDIGVAKAASSHPIPTCTSPKKALVCHIPPGNPANMHTICVSVNAVEAHVSHHGDPTGACVTETPDAGSPESPEVDAGTPPPPPGPV